MKRCSWININERLMIMKSIFRKLKTSKHKIVYTVLAAVLLCVVFFTMLWYVYKNAEADGFDSLHIQTKEIKEDINLQMISDRENLLTMANFAAKLYSDGESFDLLLNSFKSIGLIEDIGILLPDNTFMTKNGYINPSGILSFSEEEKKGVYISGRVKDLRDTSKEAVLSAVPIISNESNVAILYGIIGLDVLEERYKTETVEQDAQLYVLERGNGNFIIDTRHNKIENISTLASRQFRKSFSYKQMKDNIDRGDSGFSSFVSKFSGENLYVHYAPLEIADWHILLAKPENDVFYEAHNTGKDLAVLFLIIVLIMALYLILIFESDKKQANLNLCASKIRKLLLEINQQDNSIREALKNIAVFSKSRSAFYYDTDGEDYKYVNHEVAENNLLAGEKRNYFISELFKYVDNKKREKAGLVNVVQIYVNSQLKKDNLEFYSFLRRNGVKNVVLAYVPDLNRKVSILGVVNTKKFSVVKVLFQEILICFSIAIYNKKYLKKTEIVAATDSLTGLSNRMAYNKDLMMFNKSTSGLFSCIYIDVNELHIINNKYGHAAGDEMLSYIAKSLKDVFADSYIYRLGGDEFLVFSQNIEKEKLLSDIDILTQKVEEMKYHISIGTSFSDEDVDMEVLVKEAEKNMYAAKAKYYQRKVKSKNLNKNGPAIDHITTGIREFDTVLSIISMRYLGIYCVSLTTDKAIEILIPEYLKEFSSKESSFSKIFSNYIQKMVSSDYHRPLLNFLEYDVIKQQLKDGYVPSISYENIHNVKLKLSVYKLTGSNDNVEEVLWVFEREDI